MAVIRKTGSIPSLRLDKSFLEKLGNIVEREYRQRMSEAERLADERIREKAIEIRASDYYRTDSDKENALREMERSERFLTRPHISVSYSMSSGAERLTYGSMNEILESDLLPDNVETFSVNVDHYANQEYVDISMRFEKPAFSFLWWMTPTTYEISSSNNGNLLSVSNALNRLFSSSRPAYHKYLYTGGSVAYWLPATISVAVAISSLKIMLAYDLVSDTSNGALIASYLSIAIYLATGTGIKWLYPFFEILPDQNDTRPLLRKGFAAIAISLIAAAAYDVLKNIQP